MKYLYSLLIVCILNCTYVFSQSYNIEVEQISHSGVVGSTDLSGEVTYRLFAQLDHNDEAVTYVTGDSNIPLFVNTTTEFRHFYGSGATGSQLNSSFLEFSPEIAYDSFVTIGTVGDYLGIPRSEEEDGLIEGETTSINVLQDPNGNWVDGFEDGGNIVLSSYIGGGWFILPPSISGVGVGVNNSVMLGQFTTDGEFSFCLNYGILMDFGTPDQDVIIMEGDCLNESQCTDEEACNYTGDINLENERCDFPGKECNDYNDQTENDVLQDDCSCRGSLVGCMDENACNYSAEAVISGECLFISDTCDDGVVETILDSIQDDCSCVGELTGCTDHLAFNYNPMVLHDNGTCCYGLMLGVIITGDVATNVNVNMFDAEGALVSTHLATLGENSYPNCFEEECYQIKIVPEHAGSVSTVTILLNGDEIFISNLEEEVFTTFSSFPEECSFTGCTDSFACNYLPSAEIDNGICDYTCIGCADPNAENYVEGNSIDDGSCTYNISGVVFIDDNLNGVAEDYEPRLSYQTIEIQPENIQVITNNNGEFLIGGLSEQTHTLAANYSSSWSSFTTPQIQEIELGTFGEYNIYFGVTNSDIPTPSACVDFYQWGDGVPCNDILNYNLCYRNMSPYPISGVVEVVLDDLISYDTSYPAAEEMNGQTISWSFEDLSPWEMKFDDIIVNTPTEQSIGEFMVSSVTIYVWHDGELIPITEQTITQEVTCAYDPNDITGTPGGYTDDHLVLPDTRMEYLIRFQNTGNAPAGRVLVVDTLDPGMDASTFQLIANSHSVMTTIQPSGRIEFLFEDINLPDSISDEPGSHGMVSFKVNFKDDIAIGEEVNSTAHIYFDNNPAVITNTTWHTIHECGGESAFELSSGALCAGETVGFTSTNPLVEDYQWRIDGVDVGTESDYDQVFVESGDYEIAFLADNPLCSESRIETLTVYDVPVSEITEDGALLTASLGESYQWYLNGEEIEGATSQSHEVTIDGSYSVEVINANGCSTLSESTLLVSVNELNSDSIALYPNPMTDRALLEMSSLSAKTIRLTDAQGRLIRSWENVTDQRIEIQRRALASGKYLVTVNNGRIKKVVVLIIN